MKKIMFFASAILALASCSNETYLGSDEDLASVNGEVPISFGYDLTATTRAEQSGSAAATTLNNQFIVWGEKGETTGAAPVTDGSATNQLVFPDYKVAYTANTAYSTTSNTKDWEYVGLSWDAADATNVKYNSTPAGTDAQTIKYWDYNANSYTFTAVSAKPADIASGAVKINKLTSGTTVYDKGYEVEVTATADLASLYFADRVNIAQSANKDRTATNKYGGNVTFKFRNGMTRVRVGMFETIPGYQVKVTKFYSTGGESDGAFMADCDNTPANVAGKYTVTYYDNTTTTENQPKIEFTPTTSTDAKSYITLGSNIPTDYLKTSSAAPTYDQSGGTYTAVFPQTATNNLKLKIDYQLFNSVTGETINITGKTAEVPAAYLNWKTNYAYTYLFKITDDDLYPITFDAVVVEATDGTAEYITTVTEPSITTFGVLGGKYNASQNDYAAGSDVYATIVAGGSVVTPTLGTNVNLYKGITAGASEAQVAEAIAEVSAKTHSIAFTFDNSIGTAVTSVPTEDGNTTNINAVKMTGLAAGTYAVEYVKNARTYKYVELTYASQAEYDAAFAAVNLYTDNDGTDTAATASSWTAATDKFYKKVVDSVGEYVYKVIKVQ